MGILWKYFITAFLVSSTQTTSLTTSIDSFASSRVRRANPQINDQLPDDIIPIAYKLKLNLDYDDVHVTLNGNVEINIMVKKSTNELIIHGKNLTIKSDADIKCNHPNDVVISTIEPIDNITESFKIILSKKLYVDANCYLSLSYTNNKNSSGVTLAEYKDKKGERKWMLLSKSIAREVFPCWDDPSFKANFIISIEHSKNYIALSNMNVEKHDIHPQNPERIITHFSKSYKMSPSSVAFAIGDFIKTDDHNEKFQVWAPRDYPVSLNYAQELGPKFIRALDNYTDFSLETHGIKKVDIIVTNISMIFSAVSYCGHLIFLKYAISATRNSSNSQLEFVTQIMGHELAHQWFGCLIDGASDNDEWMTEGLANYFQYIQPTWRMMDKFVTQNIQSGAFMYDSDINSHDMEWQNSEDLNINIYRKSGSVIRMISFIIGEEKFIIALRNYVKTMAFKSATSDDFFKELINVYTGNINLMNVLKNWITTPGYPVISVKRDYDAEKVIITQSRFLNYINSTSVEKYWIPINFVTEDNLNFMDTTVTHWFDPSMNSIEINQLKKNQFVIFNKQLFGFYRVNYDNKNWELIINYLKNNNYSRIHVLNRAQLIDDAFNLAEVGQLDYQVFLSLLEYLKRETDFTPWSVAWKTISKMYDVVVNTEIYGDFKKYILELSENLERKVLSVQLNKTDVIMEAKKNEALRWTCLLGSSLCRSDTMTQLNNWLDNPKINTLPATKKEWIICSGLQNANQTFWDKAWDKYWIMKDFDIISGLACSLDTEILKRFISKWNAKEPTFWRFSLILMVFGENKMNGVTAALDYFNENYNEIIALDGFNNNDLQYELLNLTLEIKNKVQRDKLKTFIENHKASIDDGDVIIAKVDKMLKTIDKNLQVFKKFFE